MTGLALSSLIKELRFPHSSPVLAYSSCCLLVSISAMFRKKGHKSEKDKLRAVIHYVILHGKFHMEISLADFAVGLSMSLWNIPPLSK